MGDVLPELGDLLFSLVIGYLGALELLYVVRHVYHWTCGHARITTGDEVSSLERLQDEYKQRLSEAELHEAEAGNKLMVDGVAYKDGFRVEEPQPEVEELTAILRGDRALAERRRVLEAELAEQRRVEAETRAQLKQAEAELARQRRETAEMEAREQADKLLAAEREREAEQRRIEEEQERVQHEAEERECQRKQREEEERKESEQRLFEAEREREQEHQRIEEEERENEKRLIEAERQREEEQRRMEEEYARKLIDSDKQENELRENAKRLLEAEQQREEEQKQKDEEERENERRLLEYIRQEEENHAVEEEEEAAKKLLEAEKQYERQHRHQEEEEYERENSNKLIEAEQRYEQHQRQQEKREEDEDNETKLLQAEKEQEVNQLRLEDEVITMKSEKNLHSVEKRAEQYDEVVEAEENAHRIFEAELEREAEQRRLEEEQERADEEIVNRLLEAEMQRLAQEEAAKEAQDCKQRMCEENARAFNEAEEKMIKLQHQLSESAAPNDFVYDLDIEPVVEEPCTRKFVERKFAPLDSDNIEENIIEDVVEPCDRITQTVKTQFGQTASEPYSVSTKPLLFPGISDDGSSIEPNSSQQSSFSTQPSEDASTTFTDELNSIKVQYPVSERQEPDGEDNAPLTTQFSEEYLRSLDGLNRPLVREDGSGRRRAFKKRRSGSNSSNSSRESRTSREDEIKMFTSLEEEEMNKSEKEGNNEFTPIKYSSSDSGLLKVKHGHRRHHKRRSPAKDAKPTTTPKTDEQNSDGRGSLEMLGEESTDPWGEIVPGPYKNSEFWKHRKSVSIDEENADADDAMHREIANNDANNEAKNEIKDTATNVPKTASFEEATPTQHEQAISAMKRNLSKEVDESESIADATPVQSEINTNLQTARSVSPARSSASPRLRRSPRIGEMTQYEESFKQGQNAPNTPSIVVENPSWRDEFGLMLEGISDFYDFTASVNRSRSVSRNASPANSAPSTPLPKDVNYTTEEKLLDQTIIDIFDDTNTIHFGEFSRANIQDFITTVMVVEENVTNNPEFHLQNMSDDTNRTSENEKLTLVPTVYIDDTNADVFESLMTDDERQMDEMLQRLRLERSRSRSCSRSRSRSPLPTPENIQRSLETRRAKRIKQNDELFEKLHSPSPERVPTPEQDNRKDKDNVADDNCSCEEMTALVATLRAERSRSRSRSPLPSATQLERSLEMRRQKRIQHNDDIFERITEQTLLTVQLTAPSISIQSADGEIVNEMEISQTEYDECSRKEMSQLVASLRIARSRSRSKTPARHSLETEERVDRHDRERTPSRSLSQSPNRSDSIEDAYFHELLNLEASSHRTMAKNSEEVESLLVAKQRSVDAEALQALRNAHEEVELRTVTPLYLLTPPTAASTTFADEADDQLSELSTREHLRRLRCSPTTPDYERSISEEWRDVQRIKAEQLAAGFKRSTYAGESLDLGSEFEGLRRETAVFRRSRTPSPSFSRVETEDFTGNATNMASERRQLQAEILAELTAATGDVNVSVEEDVDLDELRREAVQFRRSRSNSRSPLTAADVQEIAQIEAEAAKRELQDKILDQLASGAGNFQNFSRHLNVNFLESERRASDSLLIHHGEANIELAMEPEEYHHFRRYSLAQEQPVEEYPEDVDQDEFELESWASDDYEIDFYTDDHEKRNEAFVNLEFDVQGKVRESADDDVVSEDDSEDERQTVVDVDDEIDEDFCDFVERGVTDESHHEQSECEEAEREVDQYADRDVNDWEEVHDVAELLLEAELETVNMDAGAEGVDSDSVAIDQIYDEAIRHRKQSGILRDYDSILRDMQNNYMDRDAGGSSNAGSESESGSCGMLKSESENVANDGAGGGGGAERLVAGRLAPHEMRYLGDASSTARKSTRLRSRYGYVPQLQATTVEEVDYVDVNYVPRREYNWRKNFKLDDDNKEQAHSHEENGANPTSEHTADTSAADYVGALLVSENYEETALGVELLDLRKYSLGGESITLFSRGRNSIDNDYDATITNGTDATIYGESEIVTYAPSTAMKNEEKPKKKRGKKKLRKDSTQASIERSHDEDDSESQIYSRRSSSVQLDGATFVDSPKSRKSRSRRSSKSSLTNDDSMPRDSLAGHSESLLGDINEVFGEPVAAKKKTVRKRNKKTAKDVFRPANDINEDIASMTITATVDEMIAEVVEPISTVISPQSASANALASLSPSQSVCVTPTSIKSLKLDTAISHLATSAVTTTTTAEESATMTPTSAIVTPSASVTSANTPVDTFDILKDANFYPLF